MRRQPAWLGWRLPALGIGLLTLSGLGILAEPHAPAWLASYATKISFYPASTVYILGISGISLLCWWILYLGLDRNPRITGSGPVLTFFRRYSSFALTAYVVHHVAHLWPLWLYAMWMGKNKPRYYECQAVDTRTSLILAAVFVAVFYGFLILLERHKKYSLESLLHGFASKTRHPTSRLERLASQGVSGRLGFGDE